MADSMDKMYSNVPNLRFPEFNNSWNFCKLSEISKKLEYGIGASAVSFDGNHRYIRITDISNWGNNEITSPSFLDKTAILKDKDILLARTGATVGDSFIYKDDGIESYFAGFLIRAKIEKHNPYFIYYQLKTDRYHQWVKISSARSGQPGINSEQYGSYQLSITSSEEENKIAYFLTTIDERICTQNKIIRELFALKCGLCQMIKEKQKTAPVFLVKDICKIGRGRVISKSEIEKAESHTYPVFSSQTSNNGVMGYIDSYDFDGEYLTWTTDGANAGTVFYHNEKFNCTNVCGTLKIVNESINPYFLYLILENASQKYVSKNLANPKLMNDTMANIKVNIPDLKCQNNFVNVCKAIEKRIKVEEEIFRLLLDKKKFLLSNLFI